MLTIVTSGAAGAAAGAGADPPTFGARALRPCPGWKPLPLRFGGMARAQGVLFKSGRVYLTDFFGFVSNLKLRPSRALRIDGRGKTARGGARQRVRLRRNAVQGASQLGISSSCKKMGSVCVLGAPGRAGDR